MQSALKITGGPANLGDKQSDTEGRSIFRTLATRKDPRKIAEINALRGIKPLAQRAHSAPISRAKGSDSTANILASYANINGDKIWEPSPAPGMNGKFGPAELGDKQEVTEGRVLFRHNPAGQALKREAVAKAGKENVRLLALNTDINGLLRDFSFLQRTSIFPGSIYSMPKRSVTQTMLEECRPFDEDYWVDKTHMPKKYEMKTFIEKEFARRLLAKKMVYDIQAQAAGA